jgi:hypothetical protein
MAASAVWVASLSVFSYDFIKDFKVSSDSAAPVSSVVPS